MKAEHMSLFDAALSAVLDYVAYVVSRVLGVTFNIDKDRARRAAETIITVGFASLVLLFALMGVGT